MLLNKGEAIICDDEIEVSQMAAALESEGYKIFSPEWPSIIDAVSDGAQRLNTETCGFRWLQNREYPYCVALLNPEYVAELKATGRITIDGEATKFSWRLASDVLGHSTVDLEDLL